MSLTAAVAACASLVGGQPGGVAITRATPVAAGQGWTPTTAQRGYPPLPVDVAFCRVEGRIEGTIGFELWLPDRWNGRLLGAGVGGDAGIFNYTDASRRIAEGFATVSTDTGHSAAQPRWMTNAKARADYEHRAVHLTALAAKATVARFYGKPATRSYFTGCSGGGRQALKEMQLYPSDYDGVIAGAPGPYMPLISVRMMWAALLQKADPAGALTDGDWSLYERKATAACDRADGVSDGIVESPTKCRFKTSALLCRPGQTTGCLTAPKLAMLDRIVASMPDERGRAMDAGLLPGVRTRPGPPSPLLRAMWADAVYGDPDWNEDGFRRSADLAAVNRVMPDLRADSVGIAPFLTAGHKAILYQGWADPSVIAGPTVDYYLRLAAANGGLADLARSVRLFMVPGMYHCSGGPGADAFGASGQPTWPGDPARDMLWSLIHWVERGRAPDRIVATKLAGAETRFTRTLCPFPAAARFLGGDTTQARSYSCTADAYSVQSRRLSQRAGR